MRFRAHPTGGLARPLREHDEPLAGRYETFLNVHERLASDDAVVDAALHWRVSGSKTPDVAPQVTPPNTALPTLLADHVRGILESKAPFKGLPIGTLFSSRAAFLRVVQSAWERFLRTKGIVGSRIAEERAPAPEWDHGARIEIPFEHPDIRSLVDSMFLDGTLHPLLVQSVPADLPDWLAVGIVQDPAALRNLVRDGLKRLIDTMPSIDASHRDWTAFAKSQGEILSRFHALDPVRAKGLGETLQQVQQLSDERLVFWVRKHYSDLPSLPSAAAPVMLHQIPRFLAMRRGAGRRRLRYSSSTGSPWTSGCRSASTSAGAH